MRRVALGVLALWLCAALLAALGTGAAYTVRLDRVLAGPCLCADGFLGYDELGRSVAARVWLGARTAALVGLSVTGLAGLAGVALGLTAALRGGLADLLARRLTDALLAFPGLVLAIALTAVLTPGTGSVIAALSVAGWMGFARLARAQALVLRQAEHVQAAQALGCRTSRIVLRHLLPRAAGPLAAHAATVLAGAVTAEAGLAFLGLGVPPPAPSWGGMLREAGRYLVAAPHYVWGPGLALGLVTLAAGVLAERVAGRVTDRAGGRAGGRPGGPARRALILPARTSP